MLFLGGNEHSVKVSSNSEMVRAGVLFENFGDYRELILKMTFFHRYVLHFKNYLFLMKNYCTLPYKNLRFWHLIT